jgi:hypothetical protein
VLDTPPDIEALVHKLIRKKSGAERLIMGCSMFDTAKRIAEASILREKPNVNPVELRVQLFVRFYKRDFSEVERARIINHLRKRWSATKVAKTG